ncbi:MAG: adenylyl-sulfate kinase [Deltaproteobacteria bacterium]|nr:adenylyl-sulfate kinase [Deltaproteobacteria bacterium]
MILEKINNETGAIIITGLSAAGKTTLATHLVKKMRTHHYPCFLLDACDMRKRRVLVSQGHDIASREKRLVQITDLADWIRSQGIIPVVAVIGQPLSIREIWKQQLTPYLEVYLKCSLDVCVKRDNKKLYQAALKGEEQSVIGVDIPFEEPASPDFVLESERYSSEALCEQLWDSLVKIKWFQNTRVPG